MKRNPKSESNPEIVIKCMLLHIIYYVDIYLVTLISWSNLKKKPHSFLFSITFCNAPCWIKGVNTAYWLYGKYRMIGQ